MARFVQTTAENVEAALQISEDLLQKGYSKPEIKFVVDENERDDATILKNEGIEVQFVKTGMDASWKSVKEAISLDNASNTVDDATLDAYKDDLQNGRILIVVDSPRAM